jgi:putative ABC transport system permease protein
LLAKRIGHAMNLAALDIRHNLTRLALTAGGIGLLLMLVLGMSGIYGGLVYEASLLVDRVDADLWLVQRDTRGPFAEQSSIPANVENRALSVPGVVGARRFVFWTLQRQHAGRPLRSTLQGLAWPQDTGAWLPLVAGRPLGRAHYEMIADVSLGLSIGERIKLGKDFYQVVGLTKGMTSASGDGMVFVSLPDAQAIEFDEPGEAVRLRRNAHTPPNPPATVSAVMIKLVPGADARTAINIIQGWPDLTAYTRAQERDFLVHGYVDSARRQLGLFRVVLVAVSIITMALILYTLTLDKTHDIAMLKLIGARDRVIVGLILQQALFLGAVGYGLALLLGDWLFPLFPRLVIVTPADYWLLAGTVLGISVISSLLGIWKALRVSPNTVLS